MILLMIKDEVMILLPGLVMNIFIMIGVNNLRMIDGLDDHDDGGGDSHHPLWQKSQ